MSYFVYQSDGECLGRRRADGEVAFRGTAGAVLQGVMDALAGRGGGLAEIEPATYELDRTIDVPDNVTIRGGGRATVLQPAAGAEVDVLLAAREREGVSIAELSCRGEPAREGGIGVLLESCGDCEVRGVHASHFGACGIVLRSGCFACGVLGCVTAGNGRAGVLILDCAGRGRGGNFVPNLVSHCRSYGERGSGFELEHAICVNLVGCLAHQPLKHGFHFHRTSNSTCLSGSRCFEAKGSGVRVENTHELNVSSSIFCWNLGHGIELNHVIWGTVSANNVIDSGGTSGEQVHGIYLHTDTDSVTVTGNAVFNWQGHLPMQCGIVETEDCRNNSIIANNVNYYDEEGVVCRGKGSVASENKCFAEAYSHPEAEPFAPPRENYLTNEFTRDAVEAYLERIGG